VQSLITDSFTTPESGEATAPDFWQQYYTFQINGCNAVLGYIPQAIIDKIQWSNAWIIDQQSRAVILNTPSTATRETRSEALRQTLRATQKHGTIAMLKKWRNETFPVYDLQSNVLLEIERCASALFGIVTYGVQLLCYVNDDRDGLRLWIGKRSSRKQTYPGMLDCTAAGGLPTGTLPLDAIMCEAQEEASIPFEYTKRNIKSMGPISYFHVRGPKAGGEIGLLQPEVEYTYRLELEAGMVPTPSDTEVESFTLYSVEETLESLKRGLFKPNSAVVIVKCFIEHGLICPENEPDYSEILSHLSRPLEFPVVIHSSIEYRRLN
jgi:isopentenyldiphosphate isomerase